MTKALEEYSLILKIRAMASRNNTVSDWLEECFKAISEEGVKTADYEGLQAAAQMILLLRPTDAPANREATPVPLLPPAEPAPPEPAAATPPAEAIPPMPPVIIKDGRLMPGDYSGRAYNQWFRWRIAHVMEGSKVGGAYLIMPSRQIIRMVEEPLVKAGVLKPQKPSNPHGSPSNMSRDTHPWRVAIGFCLAHMADEGKLLQAGVRKYRWKNGD